MEHKPRRPLLRWGVVLAALVLLLGVGLYAGGVLYRTQAARAQSHLTRTDLPGFGMVRLTDPEGTIPAENHCTEEGGVTVVDDRGRGWKITVPGWNLQWVMTNSLGAWIDARNIRTGDTQSFYLGSQADGFDVCPQTVGNDLKVDTMAELHRFLRWSWQTSRWPRQEFLGFVRQMTVEALDPAEVGQTIALGDALNLRQDAELCGQPVWVGRENRSPRVTLWYEPFLFEEPPETETVTGAGGLEWTLLWSDIPQTDLVQNGLKVFASGTGGFLEIDLDPQYLAYKGITTPEAALAQARAVLGHISPRQTP